MQRSNWSCVLAVTLGTALMTGCARDDRAGTAERDAERAADAARDAGRDAGAAAREAGRDATGAAREAGRDAAGMMDNAGLTAKVKSKLAADGKLSTLTNIDVDSNNGIVTLSGSVPSNEYKQMAARLAMQVDGVKRVENNLKIGR